MDEKFCTNARHLSSVHSSVFNTPFMAEKILGNEQETCNKCNKKKNSANIRKRMCYFMYCAKIEERFRL